MRRLVKPLRARVGLLGSASGLVLLLMCRVAWADEVRLKNGDRLSGRITWEDAESLVLEHDLLGTITIDHAKIDTVIRAQAADDTAASKAPVTADAPAEPAVKWKREIELGYNLSQGNTENEQLLGRLLVNRKTDQDEWTAETNGAYASSSKKMNAQRYDGMLRYAFSFGSRLAWYNFYTLAGLHDRFANIDWRATPSTGVGYWFADREDWKAMAEIGLGYEHTNYRAGTPSQGEWIATPRAFAEKTLWGNTTISEDLSILPSLEDLGNYRLVSKTELTHPLAQGLSLRFRLIDEFDSDPAPGVEDNDLRLLSSLVYSF